MIGIHHESVDREAQVTTSEAIVKAIEDSGKIDALSPDDLAWVIQGREEIILQDAFLVTGRRLLEDGRILYDQAQPTEAIPILSSATEMLSLGMSSADASKDLWEAWLVLGTSLRATSQSEEAQAAWRHAIAINPNRSPNASQFPPDLIEAYRLLQQEQLGQAGELHIKADQPNVTITVNGEERGVAPIHLDKLPPGEVHIVGRDDLGAHSYQRSEVQAGEAIKVTLNMAHSRLGGGGKSNFARSRQISDLYRAIGEHSEVDLILIAGLSEDKLSIQLYSSRGDAFSRPMVITPTDSLVNDLTQAMPELLQVVTPEGTVLSIAATSTSAPLDVSTNVLLAQLLLNPREVLPPAGSKLKWWHMALGGAGALAIGGVVTGIVVTQGEAVEPHQGTIVVGPVP